MLYNAQNGTVAVGETHMDHVCFGSGTKPLIFLPGLGDGLRTVKGLALPMAVTYRLFAPHYKIYMFSRKDRLEKGCSIRDMAADLRTAMEALGLEQAHVVGVSMGGMIAQWLAIDSPALVDKLVLAVSMAWSGEQTRAVLDRWIGQAQAGDYKGLMLDTAQRTYSEEYLRKNRLFLPLMTMVGKPRSFERFLIQAGACRKHDARGNLGGLRCPTLVIGGAQDRIAGPDAARELADAIPNSELYVYEGLGHGAYEEAPDFNRRVLEFLRR